MASEVPITDEAFADLDAITGYIKRRASIDIARKWFASTIGAIDTLGAIPTRCPMSIAAA